MYLIPVTRSQTLIIPALLFQVSVHLIFVTVVKPYVHRDARSDLISEWSWAQEIKVTVCPISSLGFVRLRADFSLKPDGENWMSATPAHPIGTDIHKVSWCKPLFIQVMHLKKNKD